MKKKVLLYLTLFCIFLVWNLLLVPLNLDEVWNYGFAHNIYSGLIPYKDFNMILTPFYPFLMSLPFHLFGSSMLVFHIEQAIILVVLCFMLFYLLKEKAWFIILFFFFPLPFSFPSYNLFLFFLFVLLLILEKKKANDYFIGFVLGLSILTKQSVGFCLFLVSFYYLKDFKRFSKRTIGMLIPVGVFGIYLIFSNSWKEFLDLCVFGLLDFSKNSNGINFYFLLLLFMVGITIYEIFKDKKNINLYYCLAFYSVMIPLFDTYHFQVAVLAFFMLFLTKNFKIPIRPVLFSLGVILGVMLVTLIHRLDQKIIYPNDIPHFEYRLLDNGSIQFTKKVNLYMKKNKNKEFFFLTSNAYYFRLVNDMPISYIDLINQGNWGYHGSDKLLKVIKNSKNSIFFVDEGELSLIKQLDKRALLYVINNGEKIDEVGPYDIYVFNKK